MSDQYFEPRHSIEPDQQSEPPEVGSAEWLEALQEAQIYEMHAIQADYREDDDQETLVLSLVENVARKDLSPVEEARAYSVLLDEFGLTLGEVAERVGRSKPSVPCAAVNRALGSTPPPIERRQHTARRQRTNRTGRVMRIGQGVPLRDVSETSASIVQKL